MTQPRSQATPPSPATAEATDDASSPTSTVESGGSSQDGDPSRDQPRTQSQESESEDGEEEETMDTDDDASTPQQPLSPVRPEDEDLLNRPVEEASSTMAELTVSTPSASPQDSEPTPP